MSRSKRFHTGRRAGWRLVLLATTVGVAALAASPAAAAGGLDQSYEGMSSSGSIDLSPEVGQTFTAGITGVLDQVELALSRETTDAIATVELRTTNDGLPTDTVLASASVPTASIPDEPAFVPLPIGPVPVTAGTRYAIVLTGNGFRFSGDDNGSYAGGDAVGRGDDGVWRIQEGTVSGSDLAFRTYVTQVARPCRLLRLSVPATPLTPPIVICI